MYSKSSISDYKYSVHGSLRGYEILAEKKNTLHREFIKHRDEVENKYKKHKKNKLTNIMTVGRNIIAIY